MVFVVGFLTAGFVYVEVGGPTDLASAKQTALALKDRAASLVAGEEQGATSSEIPEHKPMVDGSNGDEAGFLARVMSFFKGEDTQVAEAAPAEPVYKTECAMRGDKKICTVTVE